MDPAGSPEPKKSKKKKKKGKKGKKSTGQETEIDSLQKDVDQIAEIMVSNIDKILDRGDQLDNLMENAEDLEAQAKGFQVVTRKVKEKERWKYRKSTLCLAVIVICVLIAVAAIVLLIVKPWA